MIQASSQGICSKFPPGKGTSCPINCRGAMGGLSLRPGSAGADVTALHKQSSTAQHGDRPCREENRGTRLARHQRLTKWPSINRVRKLEGLEAWRSEVLEQVPAGAVAATSPRSLKWSFMNRFYYVAASNSKGWIEGLESSF